MRLGVGSWQSRGHLGVLRIKGRSIKPEKMTKVMRLGGVILESRLQNRRIEKQDHAITIKVAKQTFGARTHKTQYYSSRTLDTHRSPRGLPVWWLATEKRRVNVNPGCAHPSASLWSPKHLDPWPPGSSGLQPELTALIACWEPALLIQGTVGRRPVLQPLSSQQIIKKKNNLHLLLCR